MIVASQHGSSWQESSVINSDVRAEGLEFDYQSNKEFFVVPLVKPLFDIFLQGSYYLPKMVTPLKAESSNKANTSGHAKKKNMVPKLCP